MVDKEKLLSVLKRLSDDLSNRLQSDSEDYFNENAKREGKIIAFSWLSNKINSGDFDVKESEGD